MIRSPLLVVVLVAGGGTARVWANDPAPTQSVSPDGNGYHAPIPTDDPFPGSVYGALHNGSSFNLTYPYTSPFGFTDHARGQFVYTAAPFYPRNSEGVFGMDVWLELQDSFGNWNPVNGGVPDGGAVYWNVNTPNPGPSASRTFTWSNVQLPPNANFRIWVYVYIYNQGGSGQGDYPIYSTTQTISTGSANDAPRIHWTSSFGSTNPSQVTVGQSYTISADGQDDNGNLAAVSINKNNQPFAYAGGGNGYSGNSQNPNPSDPVGTYTFTAWAGDSSGAQSPTISWVVNVVPKASQPAVSSSNATLTYLQTFTPNYFGGAGTGGWQFVVGNQTNWDGGASSSTGTKLNPSNVWSPNWTAPSPGTYQFWIARDGDSSFSPSSAAGPYTLTVLPAMPVGSFDGIAPATVNQGQALSGSGWAADAQLGAPMSVVQILVDGGTGGSTTASLGGSRSDVQSANVSYAHWSPRDITNCGWSFSFNTSGLAQGNHAVSAIAYDNTFGVSANLGSKSFSVTLGSQTVSVAPASQTIFAGQSATLTASGGVNGYSWGGSAGGNGNPKTVTFPSPNTYSVTVYSPAGNGYSQSNTATGTVTVTLVSQSVSIAPGSATISTGQAVTFTASGGMNGYVWGGSASGSSSSQTVAFLSPGTFTVTAYSPGGGIYSQSNTANATVTVNLAAQTVILSPTAPSITAGGSVQFTASGGQNGYIWGGAAGGSGATNLVTFPNTGTYSVTVYSPAGGTFGQSNIAAATVSVNPAGQTVTLSPAAPLITIGDSVLFSAAGGMNGYAWGGVASGGGTTKTIPFAAGGTYSVTVSSPGGGNFAQSNTATSTVTVNNLPPASSADVRVKPHGGEVKVQNSHEKQNSQLLVPGS